MRATGNKVKKNRFNDVGTKVAGTEEKGGRVGEERIRSRKQDEEKERKQQGSKKE